MRSGVTDLVEVQRGVVAEGADGRQFNQGVVLSALHPLAVLVPGETRAALVRSSTGMTGVPEERLHFSFGGVGRTGDGELRQSAAVAFHLFDDKHLENKRDRKSEEKNTQRSKERRMLLHFFFKFVIMRR